MKCSKSTVAAIAASLTFPAAFAATPSVTSVTMSQAANREVTITYNLVGAPAVVTLDIQTNASEGVWASIGGQNIQNFCSDSAVWRRVETDGEYTIRWQADLSWPDHKITGKGARAVVTAWAPDNTPEYMVVDLTATGGSGTERYYPSVEFVPGGVLANADYRLTKLLMRKIMAKNVTWTMGSVKELKRGENETTHSVTLTNNYYIGVFQVTQSQFYQIAGYNKSKYTGNMRPAESMSYNALRCANGNSTTAIPANYWPNKPHDNSFLGKLRTKTGLDFDLPSECQWEFACRAGHGEGLWGDGTVMTFTDGNAMTGNVPARYYNNGGGTKYTSEVGDAEYQPNSWGLYDMHGNVMEWCLDWYGADITELNGYVNIDPEHPENKLSDKTAGTGRCIRGGSHQDVAYKSRSAFRSYIPPDWEPQYCGVRVVCTAGLK